MPWYRSRHGVLHHTEQGSSYERALIQERAELADDPLDSLDLDAVPADPPPSVTEIADALRAEGAGPDVAKALNQLDPEE